MDHLLIYQNFLLVEMAVIFTILKGGFGDMVCLENNGNSIVISEPLLSKN